jgi:hypothetical protein
MIKQHTCYTAVCDKCADSLLSMEGVIIHYASEAEAESAAEDDDWQKLPDGRLVCSGCVEDLLESGEIVQNEDEDGIPAYRTVTA